jgi:molecular chaperone GrpE
MEHSKKNKKDEKSVDKDDLEFYNENTSADFSDTDFDDDEEHAADLIKKLKKQLHASERERMENLTGWQRAKADYINLKKRGAESAEQAERQAREAVIKSFLPVFDSVEYAMRGKLWDEAGVEWKRGIESILKQILSALEENGVERVGKAGEPFDPRIHTSVSVREAASDEEAHTVAEVLQAGFRFKTGEIIRSPKVVVLEKT